MDIKELEVFLKSLLIGKHTELHLEYNWWKFNYTTLKEEIENRSYPGIRSLDWISEEEKQLAILNDSAWELTWYPNTPIGSHNIAAYSLEALIEYVRNEFG